MVRLAPGLTLLLLLGPVLAGLAGTLAPAFGLLPGLGGPGLGLWPWRDLLAQPGLGASVALSLGTGVAATLISLAITVAIFAAWSGTRAFAWIERALSPLLSVPHAAAAFGLAFLIAPSGWLARMLSPWATGWDRPPDWLIVGDPWGLSLVAGLVVKEVPFLVLLTLAAQVRAHQARLVAASLGYGAMTGWVKTVFPQVYPQIRLGVYAVLAYGLSVVDVAVILGPSTPAPLAVRLVDWMRDPDLGLWFQAAAGAVLQLGLVLGALGLWRGAEAAVAARGRVWIAAGARGAGDGAARLAALALALLIWGDTLLGLAGLAVWSVAGVWQFPDAWPQALTGRVWTTQGPALAGPLLTTLGLGLAASLIATLLVIGCLEAERRHALTPGARALTLLYLPLILPQVAFLFGLQVWAVALGVERAWPAVLLAHLVFVLPYVFLSLGDPWRAMDRRYDQVAASLGASPGRVLRAVRLPILLRPILVAAAVGLAVSVGQYLPTLLVGGGRIATLTTEGVALASGGNRRLIGATAILQSLVPLMGFALALGLPALLHRHRRGLRG